MQTPESAASTAGTPPPPAAIPVEKLIESMKPEKPLVIDSGYGTSSGSGAATSGPQ
jgi:pilus assembly protein CpaC